jgi:hypothetical protein
MFQAILELNVKELHAPPISAHVTEKCIFVYRRDGDWGDWGGAHEQQ